MPVVEAPKPPEPAPKPPEPAPKPPEPAPAVAPAPAPVAAVKPRVATQRAPHRPPADQAAVDKVDKVIIIIAAGPINQDMMEELLPLADVFLLPSSSESFGLVALEAMSAEVPVVASNLGGLPEVVEHGVTGFLHDPRSIDGFGSSVLRLLRNERLRRSMGRRGRQVAREKFDVNDMVDRYIKVYESLR